MTQLDLQLCKAVNDNNVEQATYLLQQGANPNIQDKNGVTPLYWAMLHNYQEMLYLLINRGVLNVITI
jgi:ankyrin repeat protein